MPSPDETGPRPVVVRVPAPRRDTAARIAVILAAFLAVAIVKPWPSASLSGDAAASHAPRVASAEPRPTETISPVAGYCNDPVGWRVATVEQLLDGTALRGWGAVEPIVATGPRDVRIQFFVVSSASVSALGYCAPPYDIPPADAQVRIYRVDDRRTPEQVSVVRLGPNPASSLGALYRPPPDAQTPARTAASWATGLYIFEVSTADGYQRWFGADVRLIV
jgi:hypothetical protein